MAHVAPVLIQPAAGEAFDYLPDMAWSYKRSRIV
jgi:hypothetical protein